MQIISKSRKQTEKLTPSMFLSNSQCCSLGDTVNIFLVVFFQKLSMYLFLRTYMMSSPPSQFWHNLVHTTHSVLKLVFLPSPVIIVVHSSSRKNSKITCDVPKYPTEVLCGIASTPIHTNRHIELPLLPQR